MKKTIIFIFLLLFAQLLQAEILEPVKWSFELRDISSTEKELLFKARIESGWHLYNQNLPEGGPISTEFVFEQQQGVSLAGSVQAAADYSAVESFDPNFEMNLSWYENEVVFFQKIKIGYEQHFQLSGFVRFMCCNDESCLPPQKIAFSFGELSEETAIAVPTHNETGLEVAANSIPIATISTESESDFWQPVISELKAFAQGEATHNPSSMSLWLVFIAGFAGGLFALFTPCVWPIIPMTVSFFLKRNKDRRKGKREAVFYGLSIVLIYLLLGIVITIVFGAGALNSLSTNAVFNLIFFALLIVFAVSFFGYFEITLPSSWSTALNNKAEHTTGLLSILLMAFVLVVVSFSCTGPIIGTLLVEVSSSGSILAPTIGMFGFALALSLPFSLFALFPAWLNSVPRSGGWLNEVKVSLAFLELGLALKFLSVADLTMGWGILPRPLFIGLWAAFALGYGLYMLGFIRFPHDSRRRPFNALRIALAAAAFLFTGYLITGFFGKPLKAVSAFLPPMENTRIFNDYDEGMRYAREKNMPVFLDFTGYGCVNCRKMEAAVFTDDEVDKLLSQFVLISLYVDDRTLLDTPETVQENGKNIILETRGDKWSYLQRMKFGANAQPYYVLLNNAAMPVAKPYAYDEDIARFLDFLQQGLSGFSEKPINR
ncbi:MAG: thioredoxin family protein [Prevotellaceae bacterium]|jgi:thiol:disulfide interchange protein DsbD|nr:thioredoxin family protein [Prevotellaceae bacterium]